MLDKAMAGSRRYWSWMAFLLLLAAAGFVCYCRQLSYGLGITGMSRDVNWGIYVAQFTFFVGIAASAVMVVLPYYLHDVKQFGKITILGEFLAIAAVIMCMLFIFVDMGQPLRVFNVLLYPTLHSMMFWDMLSLSGYLLLNAVISSVMLLGFCTVPVLASGAVIGGPIMLPGSTAGRTELHCGKVPEPPRIGRLIAAVVPQGAVVEPLDV